MSDSDKFKHIKVSSAYNDEVVIKAGLHSDMESHIDSNAEESTSSDSPASTSEEARNGAASSVEQVVESSKSDSGYKPTTLDDIEKSKMSKVQIVVIVIAVLAIIAFVVWYTAFS